jgi:hypothetical protein
MTTKAVLVEFLRGDPERVDGLCEECNLPALWAVNISAVFLDGIKDYGMVQFCEECNG